jgi:hypothetical protein
MTLMQTLLIKMHDLLPNISKNKDVLITDMVVIRLKEHAQNDMFRVVFHALTTGQKT